MKQELKYYLSDVWLFFKYIFNFGDLFRSIANFFRKLKEILQSERIWYWILFVLYIIVMLVSTSNKRYLFAAVVLTLWVIFGLYPVYKSGEHRDWQRKRKEIPNKYQIKKLKEEYKNGQTNVREDEGVPEGSNKVSEGNTQ